MEHFCMTHPHTERANIMVTNNETLDMVGLEQVFRWSAPCPRDSCPYVGYSNTDQAEADSALGRHMETGHASVVTRSGHQCMAGADESGDISCPAVIQAGGYFADNWMKM